MSNTLLETEKMVFDVVRNYLNEKKPFDIGKILPIICSQFTKLSVNMNKEGIERILYSLVKKKILVEGSTLMREDVLENEKRFALYRYICSNPGKYISQIENETNENHHVVVWHIKMLLRFNFLEKQKFDNHDLYYKFGIDFKLVKFAYLRTKNDLLLSYLKKNDIGTSKTQLSRDLGMHLHTIDKNLKELMDYNIVIAENIDNTTLYFLNPERLEM
ncbi:MAG: hypothetical protein JW891_11990 [Candidatus Lokiarchaeota archaeon]|nr:hypothetical protein [Candidatus Lokiarchaeota archaeon]